MITIRTYFSINLSIIIIVIIVCSKSQVSSTKISFVLLRMSKT